MATQRNATSLQGEQALHTEIADLDFVLAIDDRINTILDPQKILEFLLEEGLKIIGGENGDISLYDAQANILVLACAKGPCQKDLPQTLDARLGISGRALRERQPQIVPDVAQDPDYQALCAQHALDTPYGRFLRSFCSTVKIPLLMHGSPIGIFCVHSSLRNEFPARKVKLLEVLLRRAAWALHSVRVRVQTLSEAWQRAADISASLGIGELLNTRTPLPGLKQLLYNASARKGLELTGARSANLRLINVEKQLLWFAGAAGKDWTPDKRETTYRLDEEAAATWAVRERKTYHIHNLALEQGTHFLALFPWAISHVSVPLIDRAERVLGVLSVTADQPYAFHADHILALELLARTITVSLAHVDLIDRLSLQSLEQRLVGATTMQEICERAIEEVCTFLPARAGSLFMYDPARGDFILQATTNLQPTMGERIAYRPGEGLTGWVAKHKRALRLRDCQDTAELQRIAPDLQWQNKYREEIAPLPHPMRYLGIPLFTGHEVIGVMRMVYRDDNQEFTEADEQWLLLAAGAIASVLERLNLQQDAKQRVTELAALYDFSKLGAQCANVDDILQAILRRGLPLFGCSKGHIRIRDKHAEQLRLYDTFGDYGARPPVTLRQFGEGLSGRIAREKTPSFTEHTPLVGVPLIVDHQVLGTLIAEKDDMRGFSRTHLHALESLAAIAASAVRKHWLSEGLSNIARAIVEVEDIDELYRRMHEEVQCLIPTDVFYVALYNEFHGQWTYPYVVERGCRQATLSDDLSLAMQTFHAAILRDPSPVHVQPQAQFSDQSSHSRNNIKIIPCAASLLFAPIVLPGGKLMGVLSAQSYDATTHTQEHCHLLATIASQASIAIPGTTELQQTRRFGEIRERIYRTGATGDFSALLQVVLQSAHELTDFPRGLIRLVDEHKEQLILAAASDGLDVTMFPLTRPLDKGIIGRAVMSCQPQWAQNAHGHADFTLWYEDRQGTPYQHFLDSLEAIIAVPLLVEGKAIGALVVYGDEGTVCPEYVAMLQLLANAAALPIRGGTEKAKNHLQDGMITHFEGLLRKGSAEEDVLEDALQYAEQLTGCKDGHILVLDPSQKWLIQRNFHGDYLRGLPERQPSERGIHGRVLHLERSQLVTDLQKVPEYREYLRALEQESTHIPEEMKTLNALLVVPLQTQDIPYGILCLHDPQPNIFTGVQMALMDRLGTFIGTLIAQTRETQEIQRLAMRAELGDLAAFVAHEINTPLGIITMKADRLLSKVSDPQQQEKLQEIIYEAERGAGIVDELLDYAGRQHGEGKGCDLKTAITHALRLIESTPERKQIQLHYDPQEVPSITMSENRVKQIFFNLVRNALEAMPYGGILTIHTTLARDEKHVELRVCDTGIGIARDLHDKIFQLHFTTKEYGTGLGLAVCRKIAREHGGDITVESEEGQGSTFIVTLPIEE